MISLISALNGRVKNERTFDQGQLEVYASQGDFDYMNYTVTPPSVWERLSWWFQRLIERFFMNPNTPWLTQIAYYILLLLVLGLAVFYIVRLRYGGGVMSDYETSHFAMGSLEKATSHDFDNLIRGAITDQNYRLAIRYVYLKALSDLAKKEHVKLKDWKSPYDYERELKAELVESYQEIARLFEYVWYGDFEAGSEEYERGKALSSKLEQAG